MEMWTATLTGGALGATMAGRAMLQTWGGPVEEPGIRPGFWITIIAGVVLVILLLRGQWEWAVVALIAAMVLGRFAFIRWPRRRR